MFRAIKSILRLALLLLLSASLLFFYARYAEPGRLEETKLLLQPGASVPAQPLNIVIFADTHFSSTYTPQDFERAVERINAMQPDLVFFLGDLIDNYNDYDGDPKAISQALAQIHTTGACTSAEIYSGTSAGSALQSSGKFAVFGNHDYGGGLENYYQDIMEAGGFQVLLNETVALPACNVTITGIDDMIIGYGDVSCASILPDDTFNIVLAHEPDIITDMTDFSVDFMVSGHTHGGQINLPYLSEQFLPPYGKIFISGEYRFENQRSTLLYVNRGLGTTKLPLRFMAAPELTQITFD